MSCSENFNLVTEAIFWAYNQIYYYPNISASIGMSFASAYLLNRSAETTVLIGILTFTFSQLAKFKIFSKKEDKSTQTEIELIVLEQIGPQEARESITPPVPSKGYHTFFDGLRTTALQPQQTQDLNEYIFREIMRDEDYLRLVEEAGLSREIALSVFPGISNVSGFTICHNDKAYHLGMTDNLRKKIHTIFDRK